MASKPASCIGCPLYDKGTGWVPPSGPENAPMLIVGEAPGVEEGRTGTPFCGPSGEFLNRQLHRVGIDRESVRVTNLLRCQPPGDWLVGAPWEEQAVYHCSRYLEPELQSRKVVLTVGASASRRLLGQPKKGWELNNWHGSPTWSHQYQTWIVATFHPAFLLRGNSNLTGAVLFDIRTAKSVVDGTFKPDVATLVVDPPAYIFDKWVEEYLSFPDGWMAVDIETPGKASSSEDDLDALEDSFQILRINFAHNTTEGLTVPWAPAYMDGILKLLGSPGPKIFWNQSFDLGVLQRAGVRPTEPVLDAMWAWHMLQSSLPRGLGFAAPFYSRHGAWKHLSGTEPGEYAATDAVQTLRTMEGVVKDLKQLGMFESYWRHIYMMDAKVLRPASEVGLLLDKPRLETFGAELREKQLEIVKTLTPKYPVDLLPWRLWKKKPTEEQLDAVNAEYSEINPYWCLELEEVMVTDWVRYCFGCDQIVPTVKHRCKDERGKPRTDVTPSVKLVEKPHQQWGVKEPFNPGSDDQIRLYMQNQGIKGKKSHKAKTDKASVDEKALTPLAKKDPFYQGILDYRAISKVNGTYVEGMLKRLGDDGRIHTEFTHVPSTLRLSSVNPNLQNVVADKEEESPAQGFRKAVVASEGCVLIEADFSAIEAVLSGYFMGDETYMKLAKVGVHAYLTSHLVGKPADLTWTTDRIKHHLKLIKESCPRDYNRAKRIVHGQNYGMTVFGVVRNYPELFTLKSAQDVVELYYKLCPALPRWHESLRQLAHKQHYLGRDNHPFHYQHWFWDVYTYNSRTGKLDFGSDSNKVVSFYPQSTAAGVIYEACLRLVDEDGPYDISKAFFGRTPIRALVHDSILVEVEERLAKEVTKKMVAAMTQPIPELGGLVIDVEVKTGKTWNDMYKVDLKELMAA